jgi:hypothetical protein
VKARTYRIEDRATLMRVAGSLSNMLVSPDKPLMVEVSDYREQRSTAQNRLLHAILRDVAENIEVGGKRFSQEAWKEQFRRQFIGTEEVVLPTGQIIEQGISTTTLNKGQMVEAMDRFLAWLASDFGYMAQELAA